LRRNNKGVGKTAEIIHNLDGENYEVIDASGKAVLPGFVDSHTQFVFGGYRRRIFLASLQGKSYMDDYGAGW
jgi:imidazolonepropionase